MTPRQPDPDKDQALVLRFDDLGSDDTALVGGKNSSLGEMIGALKDVGIRVPGGFATTARAYWHFIGHNDLDDRLRAELGKLKDDQSNLRAVGKAVRKLIDGGQWPGDLADAIVADYEALCRREGIDDLPVAVRSSATAEDLPTASFAGQLESYLNVRGADDLLDKAKACYASLFTDRAIAYRVRQGFDHMKVALSAGVQRMVRSDTGSAGVMFSLDTDSGFPDVVMIDGAFGLGETVVQGISDPDEWHVYKPLLDDESLRPIIEKKLGGKAKKMVYGRQGGSTLTDTPAEERGRFVLSDDEVLTVARWAVAIERHYGRPMDMEWARDGETQELFIVQARPETVHSAKEGQAMQAFSLKEKAEPILRGAAIGASIAAGPVKRLDRPDQSDRFEDGDVLVTAMTDPDWVPLMKKAAAVVTDHGGRTSHAAIVSRELGLTAVVGTGEATKRLKDGQEVTVSCAEGDEGRIYDGRLDFSVQEVHPETMPETRTGLQVNLANPSAAYRWWTLPAKGVGLARMEFIIGNRIKIHPLALARFDALEDKTARKQIEELTAGYASKTDYFVDVLARGIARIAAVYHPHEVIVRLSDFKTNEYAQLIGGAGFEPDEENPMLGWRGASRYYDEGYRDGFALECRAIAKARQEIGLGNVKVMVPFCRSPMEADRVLEEMAANGLVRGKDGLAVYVMAEIPANIILAEDFAARFDGFSIGSNDLTQLTLGIDRDNARLASQFDARDPAVKALIADLLHRAKATRTKVGICGQAPSDYPDFAQFLVAHGIDTISVSPDSFLDVLENVASAERQGDKA